MGQPTDFVRQAGAIPVKGDQVCLVTSSNGKRWVIPKGLIDPGHTAGEAALQEAWEEAGLAGTLDPQPLGSYVYDKGGRVYHVTVFLMQVSDVFETWPEDHVRERNWVRFTRAMELIEDPGLRKVLKAASAVHKGAASK